MKKKLIIIAHNIRSAHNVGAIFRASDGAGVSEIYLTGYSQPPFSKKDTFETKPQRELTKTALGAEKNILWKKEKNISSLISKLKADGVKIYALENTKNAKNIFDFQPQFPCALILGNEVSGLADDILNESDETLKIPMRGKKESLNVSVAAGVAMYEIFDHITRKT